MGLVKCHISQIYQSKVPNMRDLAPGIKGG